MILVDALYINKGGGKVLLDLLIIKLQKNNIETFYLLDKRVEKDYRYLNKNVKFLKASLIKRHFFYNANKYKFRKVLTFSNLPPTIRLTCEVYTFFHNVLLINNKIQSPVLYLKEKLIFYYKKNTDFWIVQSNAVKNLIQSKNISNNHILVLPFFNDFKLNLSRENKIYNFNDHIRFLYVSSGEPHKNHLLLLNAFVKLSKIYPQSILTITIGDEYESLLKKINFLIENGVPLINKYFLSKQELEIEYLKTDIFIFPSLKESFGLGLIEATQYCLPIIASDLRYVHEIIIPADVFNPYDEISILNAMLNFKNVLNLNSKCVIKNEINNLI